MFTKEEHEKKEKYRITAIFYVLADSENAALESIKRTLVEDADEKRITKMRRS